MTEYRYEYCTPTHVHCKSECFCEPFLSYVATFNPCGFNLYTYILSSLVAMRNVMRDVHSLNTYIYYMFNQIYKAYSQKDMKSF